MESIIKLFTTVASDFEVLWLASRDLLTTNNPYLNIQIFTGVGYPPNSLLFYLPLTFFNYFTAQNIFTMISLISLVCCIYFSFEILNIKNRLLFILFIIFAFLSFPTKFTFGMGQNNFIALAMLLASFYYFKSKKIYTAGILLGLAISLKTIFVYFILFYVIKKQWKLLLSAFVVVLITTFVIYIIRGNLNLYKFYITNVLPPLFRFENREIYYNQGFSGFISRLFIDINLRKNITLVLSIIFVGINIYFIKFKKNLDLLFSLTTITLLLIDGLAWQHHFVWLIFPYIFILYKSKTVRKKLFILISYILVSLNIPNSYFLSSNVFLGVLILYCINISEIIGRLENFNYKSRLS